MHLEQKILAMGLVVIIMIKFIGCYQYWRFKELSTMYTLKQILLPSKTTFYLFSQPSTTLEECAILCTDNPNCRAIFIYQNVCFGTSEVVPDSNVYSKVRIFVKQPNNECPDKDFVYYNGICMLLSHLKVNWYEARKYCEDRDSHLLVLDSGQKVKDTKEFIQTYYRYHAAFYVGASDEHDENVWKWSTMTDTSDYFFFMAGQPNNEDTKYPNKPANCGAAFPFDLLLMDEYCYQKKRFICEL